MYTLIDDYHLGHNYNNATDDDGTSTVTTLRMMNDRFVWASIISAVMDCPRVIG